MPNFREFYFIGLGGWQYKFLKASWQLQCAAQVSIAVRGVPYRHILASMSFYVFLSPDQE